MNSLLVLIFFWHFVRMIKNKILPSCPLRRVRPAFSLFVLPAAAMLGKTAKTTTCSL